MANRQAARVDRLTQMSKQEELIARKRQEFLDKQRTAQLAKAVAAAQTLAAKLKAKDEGEETETANIDGDVEEKTVITIEQQLEDIKANVTEDVAVDTTVTKKCNLPTKTGKITFGLKRTQTQGTVVEEPPSKAVNTFCNDGSFLENFKKILEKSEQPKPLLLPETFAKLTGQVNEDAITTTTTATIANAETTTEDAFVAFNTQQQQQQQQQQSQLSQLVAQHEQILLPHLNMSLAQPPPPPPPPPIVTAIEAGVHGTYFTTSATSVVPPPPPPPQIPLAIAQFIQSPPLYMIPPPEPLQLNSIPPPKEFNLNVIPKPQLNLDVIQVPDQQQHQTQVFSDNNDNEKKKQLNDNLPTSVEMLITTVAVNGDDYEENLCNMHKNNLHPKMWFIFDKNSEQYHAYRQQVIEIRQQQQEQQKIDNNNEQQLHHVEHKEIPKRRIITCDSDKYDPETAISNDIDSDDEYMRGMMDRNRDNIKRRIECRNELSEEERQETAAQESEEQQCRAERKRQRKSRWGEKVLEAETTAIATVQTSFANQNKPMLKSITRTDPALLNYARNNYGTTDLNEDDWKKCEEHFKVNLLYQDMMSKRQEIDRLARNGKFKFEYDSDEDVEGGTWEHKLRCAEMEATQAWASALTKQSEGKHHIGDFLPPEELKKFMEQYEAKKNDRQPDLSDYKEYKLKEDNIGFQMLQKLGWKEGQGLGQDGAGIVDPVNKGPQREGNQGLGVSSAASPENNDNEYDAYRKRMMLAYRFRPNPLNNPRRAYY